MNCIVISFVCVVIGVLKQFRHSSQPLNWTRGLQLSLPESGPSTPRASYTSQCMLPRRKADKRERDTLDVGTRTAQKLRMNVKSMTSP